MVFTHKKNGFHPEMLVTKSLADRLQLCTPQWRAPEISERQTSSDSVLGFSLVGDTSDVLFPDYQTNAKGRRN